MDQGEQRVTICVPTFRRPDGLARLLSATARMSLPRGWTVDVLVVDNDARESGKVAVDRAVLDLGLPIEYRVETQRGIPQVRNRCLRETKSADWIAFLDDDEWPTPTWFESLVRVQVETGAPVLIGPSEPVFEVPPPNWIREGRFFERERFATGSAIPFWRARSSGVLIDRSLCDQLGDAPFDERFPLAGGTDRMFFSTLQNQGALIVWVDDAVVYESVPASRARLAWLLRRSYRTGISRSVTLLMQEDATVHRRVRRIGRGILEVGGGLADAAAAHTTAARVQGLTRTALGTGLVVGAMGIRYNEYATTHGH
jgi:glycosyltransferase involved in cell wall biosynthesis